MRVDEVLVSRLSEVHERFDKFEELFLRLEGDSLHASLVAETAESLSRLTNSMEILSNLALAGSHASPDFIQGSLAEDWPKFYRIAVDARQLLRQIQESRSLAMLSEPDGDYMSKVQEVVALLRPGDVTELRAWTIDRGLPTSGFDRAPATAKSTTEESRLAKGAQSDPSPSDTEVRTAMLASGIAGVLAIAFMQLPPDPPSWASNAPRYWLHIALAVVVAVFLAVLWLTARRRYRYYFLAASTASASFAINVFHFPAVQASVEELGLRLSIVPESSSALFAVSIVGLILTAFFAVLDMVENANQKAGKTLHLLLLATFICLAVASFVIALNLGVNPTSQRAGPTPVLISKGGDVELHGTKVQGGTGDRGQGGTALVEGGPGGDVRMIGGELKGGAGGPGGTGGDAILRGGAGSPDAPAALAKATFLAWKTVNVPPPHPRVLRIRVIILTGSGASRVDLGDMMVVNPQQYYWTPPFPNEISFQPTGADTVALQIGDASPGVAAPLRGPTIDILAEDGELAIGVSLGLGAR